MSASTQLRNLIVVLLVTSNVATAPGFVDSFATVSRSNIPRRKIAFRRLRGIIPRTLPPAKKRGEEGEILPTVFLSTSARAAPVQKVQINQDAVYQGEPTIGNDGTEGNGAYYSGNYLPVAAAIPKQHQKYWRKSPYWNYFKSIWGNAPMADTNFELWLRGFFKDFTLPRHPQSGQTTRGLPAWLHYYSQKYDPLVDPPYISDYALFAGGESASSEVGAPEQKRPAGIDIVQTMGGESALQIFGDCSEYGDTTIDRPCTKRAAQRYQIRPYKARKPQYWGGLDMRLWPDKRNMAGPMVGNPTDAELKKTYIKTDNWWGDATLSTETNARPANLPPPPAETALPPA